MGQNNSYNPLRENLEYVHGQLMKTAAGADLDIATATTLSYDMFLGYITRLNDICGAYEDGDGFVLVFAVKKGSDSSIFWKATVRVACVKLHREDNQVHTYRLLTIRQFLQVFRRITYECTGGELGEAQVGGEASAAPHEPMPPTVAASIALGELTPPSPQQQTLPAVPECEAACGNAAGGAATSLEECVICLERRPEVLLPCAHAYCVPCIEQWWEYAKDPKHDCFTQLLPHHPPIGDPEKTCPVCRESLSGSSDTWVLSEAPDDDQVNAEIRKALLGLAEGGPNCVGPG